jgi:peroxiredoxin
MNSRSLIFPLVVLALAGGLWLIWPQAQMMPDARFVLLDGRKLDSQELRGRPVLVNFWSVTCSVCVRDMPRLERLQETLRDRDLLVIGVALSSDPPPVVLDFVEKHPPGIPIALDVHGEVSRAFGDVQVTPTTFLIDPAGRIRYRESGPLDEVRIRATLATFSG